MMTDTLYDILGVSRHASADEIKAAYRQLAKAHHPDLNPNDAGAEDRFARIAAAYAILGDANLRRRYDAGEIKADGAANQDQTERRGDFYRNHARGAEAEKYRSGLRPEDFGRFARLFEDLFGSDLFAQAAQNGRDHRGTDLRQAISISFMDAVLGASVRVPMVDGRVLDIAVPAGIETGQTIRVRGQGTPGLGGAPAGDALLRATIDPHPLFRRDGLDIILDLPITMAEAVLGGSLRVPTIHGAVSAKLPPGSASGSTLRLKGKGIHRLATGERGDLLAEVRIVLPDRPDPQLAEALAQWQSRAGDHPRSEWEAYLT